MERSVGKRGVSPVIASVLLIALTLVLAAIIFLWARGFVGEQVEKFGSPIEDACNSVDLDIARFNNEIEVRNSGNVDISYLEIKKVKGGDSEVSSFPIKVDAGDATSGGVDMKMSDGSIPDEIIVYPTLVGKSGGSNKPFTCVDAGITL